MPECGGAAIEAARKRACTLEDRENCLELLVNDVPDDNLDGKAFLLGAAAAPGDCARRGKSTCSPQVQRIRGPMTDSSLHNSDARDLPLTIYSNCRHEGVQGGKGERARGREWGIQTRASPAARSSGATVFRVTARRHRRRRQPPAPPRRPARPVRARPRAPRASAEAPLPGTVQCSATQHDGLTP